MTTTAEDATTLGTLAGVFLVALLTQYHAWKNQQATKSVAQSLEDSTARRDRSLAMIHALVNSGKAALLEKLMDSTAQLAKLSPDDKAAQARADWARRDYDNHMSQQSAIDMFFAQKDAQDTANDGIQVTQSVVSGPFPVTKIPWPPAAPPSPTPNTQPKGP